MHSWVEHEKHFLTSGQSKIRILSSLDGSNDDIGSKIVSVATITETNLLPIQATITETNLLPIQTTIMETNLLPISSFESSKEDRMHIYEEPMTSPGKWIHFKGRQLCQMFWSTLKVFFE